MSSNGFEIIVDDNRVNAALREMERRAINKRPVMARIGMIMLKSTHENFEAQGRPQKWKPRSIKTMLSYEESAVQQVRRTSRYKNTKSSAAKERQIEAGVKKMRGNLILHRSGYLKQSIVIGAVTNDSVEIGSSAPYARIHQLGGKIKAVTIRARRKKALLIPTQYGYVLRKSANIPARSIPARPYLVLQQHDYDVIAQMTAQHVLGGGAS